MSYLTSLVLVILCFGFNNVCSMELNNKPCRSVRISNGVVRCPNMLHHQSICTFYCDENYSLSTSTGSLEIYCNDGVWQILSTNTRFDFLINYCLPVDSRDQSTSKNSDQCSDDVCGYGGIPKGACLDMGCCWDTEADEARCRDQKINDSPCPTFYNGAPRSVCDSQSSCYYDTIKRKCFLRNPSPTPSLSINSRELSIDIEPTETVPEDCSNFLESFPDAQWQLLRFTCSKQFKPGTTCVFNCDVTHVIVGQNRLKCNKEGSWDGKPPMCIEKQVCPTFYNGAPRSVCETQNNCYYDINDKKCYLNIDLMINQITSREFVIGSKTETVLQENIPEECPDLREEFPSTDWSILQFSCSNEFSIGSTCVLTCDDKYLIAGQNRIKCGTDGNWKNKPPTCIHKTKELKRCDLEIDLSSKKLSAMFFTNETKEFVNLNYLKPANRYGSINRQLILEINYSKMQSLSLQMNYTSPSSQHFEIGDMTSSLKGNRLHLMRGRTRQVSNMFSNARKVIFHFRPGNPTVFYIVISSRTRRVLKKGSFLFKAMSDMEKVYLSANRLIDLLISSRARGMQRLCISYTT